MNQGLISYFFGREVRARGDFFAKKSRKKLLTPRGLGRLGALCGGVGDGGRAMPAEGRKPFLGRVAACHSPGWPGGRGWWRWALGMKFFWFFLFTKRTGLAWLFLGLAVGDVAPGLPRRQGAPRNDGVGRRGVALCSGEEVFLVLFVHKKNVSGLAYLGLGVGGVAPGLPRRQGAPRNDGVGRGGWRWALGRKFFWFFLFTKRTGLAWLFWGWGSGMWLLDCRGA